MIIYLSLLIAIVGLFMYIACDKPKLAEIGRLAFFAGLFVFLFRFGSEHVAMLGR